MSGRGAPRGSSGGMGGMGGSPDPNALRALVKANMTRSVKIWPIAAAVGGLVSIAALYKSVFTVGAGECGIVFNKLTGTRPKTYTEGLNFLFPFIESPIIYNIRPQAHDFRTFTGSQDLQMVDIGVRVLVKPMEHQLPEMYQLLGTNYNERVLPSIVNEVCKAVVARFSATDLLTQRELVSETIKDTLRQRSMNFNIDLKNISIMHLSFSDEFDKAVDRKQVAQQEAERAKFLVDRAVEQKKAMILKAEGQAQAAVLVGQSINDNPNFIRLRRIEAAQEIASILSQSRNKALLDSRQLLFSVVAEEIQVVSDE
eukprot:TRINITY_DN2512_c2_g3_i1.p1 TRINITY_DN2512_c2_g3~~TRINITY_DN2512_c2_g3_i1.p1  ORF type:complete len:341 (+),score=96.74 TRINITY_DN2512_c2_g3_i1:85-1023(+)